jgi:NADH-quinone oxidoreductase subunit C
VVKKTVKVKTIVEAREGLDQRRAEDPGYSRGVYHSTHRAEAWAGVVRMRTAIGRTLFFPSLTPPVAAPSFRSARSTTLYGIASTAIRILRRILMWDEFVDHPMRRDYVQPDDFEYEPTPHDEVLERAKQHYSDRPIVDGAEPLTAQP